MTDSGKIVGTGDSSESAAIIRHRATAVLRSVGKGTNVVWGNNLDKNSWMVWWYDVQYDRSEKGFGFKLLIGDWIV